MGTEELGISLHGYEETKGSSVLAKINRGQDKRKLCRVLRDTGTKCSYHAAKSSSRYSPFWSVLGWAGGISETRARLCEATGRAGSTDPVRFCPLITVHPKKNWDVRLGWERESCEYWQKSSSVLALVPQAILMLMLLCSAGALLEFRAL